MGVEYYAFALFIAALICIIAIIIKMLFGNVRRQRKLLDEKETELLQLYRSVEGIMEGFNDQIQEAMDDIKEHENRAAEHMAALSKQAEAAKKEEKESLPQPERKAKAMTVDSSRIRAASEVLERAERMIKGSSQKKTTPAAWSGSGDVIQRLFDDPMGEPADDNPQDEIETQIKNNKREDILALSKEGKTHSQIARDLGITQNEVKLVIGLGAAAR